MNRVGTYIALETYYHPLSFDEAQDNDLALESLGVFYETENKYIISICDFRTYEVYIKNKWVITTRWCILENEFLVMEENENSNLGCFLHNKRHRYIFSFYESLTYDVNIQNKQEPEMHV